MSRASLVVLLAAGFAGPVFSQHLLVVEHEKKAHVVRRAKASRPIIEESGQPVFADGHKFALKKIDEFLPVFVRVSNVRARSTRLEVMSTGNSINHQFEFHANFSTAHSLADVFVVLALQLEGGEKSLFLYEVGQLDPNRTRSIDVAVRTGYRIGEGKYQLHVFSSGMEVLHSKQPFEFRETMLDRMVARRVKGRADGPPQPFIGPPPDHPPKLLKAKREGEVILNFRVRTNGAIADPVVASASEPEFGEAALVAMRQWRFFPQIKDGRPVETTATMPLKFPRPTD